MGVYTAVHMQCDGHAFAGCPRCHRLANDGDFLQFSRGASHCHALALYTSGSAIPGIAAPATSIAAQPFVSGFGPIDAGAVPLYCDDDHRRFCLPGRRRAPARH